jgi:hypothetical protein
MKKRERKTGRRFKATVYSQAVGRQPEELEPEELALYIRRAEEKVLPIIKEVNPGPAAAQFLLAQQTRVLVTGDPRLTVESGMAIANAVLSLWQDGYYSPSSGYPYTLLETLQDLQEGAKAKEDYSAYFQPFTPVNEEPAHGKRQVAAGIVKHPETQLWQIWAILDGPCVFFGAYADPAVAHRGLEALINLSRRGGTRDEALALYKKLLSQGDGEPKQLPFDMLKFLTQRLHLYTIQL